jgi:hypothetical protein
LLVLKEEKPLFKQRAVAVTEVELIAAAHGNADCVM